MARLSLHSLFAFLFWLRTWVVLVMMIPAVVIAWSRIYLGVHWPLDMAGAFILAIVACGLAQILWSVGAYKIQLPLGYSFILPLLFVKVGFNHNNDIQILALINARFSIIKIALNQSFCLFPFS